ncbi:DUF86 domain-containing protein [Gloeobacter kilaueensis]|uniref:Nucleotidyltransferase n=1 Tax=Gloeobacter kilaueensis (strain ATCC BAA-2537 / CCAP 1431/1 / ULC 316 / JS1) TaxID=1183438 RepID=U5QKV6_GLOK1|nr:HepT-like ribonuclease domain-containing protein [Gloeobacter kilaueensis]AGY59556.1 hypothetical protein GKIL_3310 [Gloeobacter kilaueensis JS1]
MSSHDVDRRLSDILDAASSIQQYTANLSELQFISGQQVVDAVNYNLIKIGEAVANLPEDFKEANPDIPWQAIKRTRNFITIVILWWTPASSGQQSGLICRNL